MRRKRLLCFVAAGVVLFALAAFLRGPHISNILKKIILPEIELATGKRAIAQKIYINIFPLFVEARDMKIFDENGKRLLLAKRVKAYIRPAGLIGRKLTIRRLVIREPEFTTEVQEARELIGHVQRYLAETRETAIKVTVKAVEVQDGKAVVDAPDVKAATSLQGLFGEVIISKTGRARAEARQITFQREGWEEVVADALVNLQFAETGMAIDRLVLRSGGSSVEGRGEVKEGGAAMRLDVKLLVDTVKRIFGLRRSGEGELRVSGTLQYADREGLQAGPAPRRDAGKGKGLTGITVGLDVQGEFRIETLMEFFHVEEKVEGLVAVGGRIEGPVHDLRADGRATLRNGNLFTVAIESLRCRVSYKDGFLNFSEGEGRLYNGTATVSASLSLPHVNFFSVDVDVHDVDSRGVFGLIRWDPGISEGKVSGRLSTSGAEFNPKGSFVYRSTVAGKDVLGRVQRVAGEYDLTGTNLLLSGLELESKQSRGRGKGRLDIGKETLDLEVVFRTDDLADITGPYYDKVRGAAEFDGTITGVFDDPVVSGRVRVSSPVIEGYAAASAMAEGIYRKAGLHLKELLIQGDQESHTLRGEIRFPEAKHIFDLAAPRFSLEADLANADLTRFSEILRPGIKVSGRITSQLRITGTGDAPEVSGHAVVKAPAVYEVPLDSASLDFRRKEGTTTLTNIRATRGRSSLGGDCRIADDGRFSYRAAADRLLLSDIIRRPIQGDAVISLTSHGEGTIESPVIAVDARILEGVFRGKAIGSGTLSASVKGREFSAQGSMISDRVRLTARGRLDGAMPWEGHIDIESGRYDFLVSSLLKDVPEDLVLSLGGRIDIHGSRSEVVASAALRHLLLSMYGYSFSNEEEIRLSLKDRRLALDKVALRSGTTFLRAAGGVTIGKEYDLIVEGSSALSPFKSVSGKLAVLRGDAEFVVAVTGGWETPEFNGGVTVRDGLIGLKDYHYRVANVNGYLYVDNDRIVLQRLTGTVGGGNVEATGILYLKRFSVKRFFVEAKLQNVTASISSDFTVTADGNILYRGTPVNQTISGDISVLRARYRERVEWKSWLLQAKKAEKFKAELSNFDKAELNIRVAAKDTISVENNVARASLSADMLVRGTVFRPIPFGRLETSSGVVYFRNNQFRIITASADFSDQKRINPIIGISAETITKGYKVKMNLEGQIDRFTLSLTSDPPLKEMDILALLTVGQTGQELKGLEAGIGAGEATSFVTGMIQDVVEERLKTITGLDRVQVDPYVSKSTGSVEPRVTVSKRLLGDRVFVTYTTSVGSIEEQILRLEYYVSKTVSLVGVRDERGIMGGDVRLRFEFK